MRITVLKFIRKKLLQSISKILKTDLQENVWQQEGRINNQILGVKGLVIVLSVYCLSP